MKNFILFAVIIITVFGFNNAYAQDWANLKRFQDENAQLIPPDSNQKRIVFMGNSIT